MYLLPLMVFSAQVISFHLRITHNITLSHLRKPSYFHFISYKYTKNVNTHIETKKKKKKKKKKHPGKLNR